MLRVYVAGPYTKPDPVWNTNRAVRIANVIADLGMTPFVPHLTLMWHLIVPKPYEWWLAYDLEWLSACDALYRIDGESSGADKEVEHARTKLGVPVFTRLDELVAWAKEHGLK